MTATRDDSLEQAIACHRSGDLEQAARIYERRLKGYMIDQELNSMTSV